jgi:glycosyltransferase involved in cell wall biosynthesis
MVVPKKYDTLHLMYHKHFLTRIIHRCDGIIAVSKSTKNDILKYTKYPESKIHLISLGINNHFYHPIPKEPARDRLIDKYDLSDPFLLYVSRIEHPGKNHIRLIQVFEELKKRNNIPHKLVIAGADWNGAEQVHEYAANSPQKDNIIFLGFAPLDDIRDLYNTCDLLVFPSLYEGFGLPVIEAMACGTRVVCSRTSSLTEIAEGYASMFDPFSHEEMYRVILEALESRHSLNDQMRNIQYASTFDWNEVAKKVVKVYEQV